MPGVDYFFKKCSGRVEFSESIVVLKVETRLDEELKIRVGLRIHVTEIFFTALYIVCSVGWNFVHCHVSSLTCSTCSNFARKERI